MNVWRLVLDGRYDFRSNMERDSAMLESVAAGRRPGVLRIYNWSEPAVTVGFHQRSFSPVDPCLTIPVLERPTGGGAVLHGDDITFSLSAPEAGVFSRDVMESCRAVTEIFACALRRCGLDARMQGGNTAFSRVCFQRSSPVELCVGDAKILGLAALRKKGFMLFQGVMPLTVDAGLSRRVFGDEADPNLKGIRDYAPGFSEDAFLESLMDAFASQADLLFSQGRENDGQEHHDDEGEVHLRRQEPGNKRFAEE